MLHTDKACNMKCGKNGHGYCIGKEGTLLTEGCKNGSAQQKFLYKGGEQSDIQNHDPFVIFQEAVYQFLIHVGGCLRKERCQKRKQETPKIADRLCSEKTKEAGKQYKKKGCAGAEQEVSEYDQHRQEAKNGNGKIKQKLILQAVLLKKGK